MTFARQTSPHGTLVAVSTMKDEAPYVLEWVAHHLAVGFTDVLVYTNDCTDDTDTLLKHLERLGIGVHHRENAVPEGIKPQPSMLRRASDEVFLHEADWILILDADEFLSINHPSGTLDGMVADLNAMQAQTVAAGVFRSDIYRQHLGPAGADLPAASAKVEGSLAQATPVASSRGKLILPSDQFYDAQVFDPGLAG